MAAIHNSIIPSLASLSRDKVAATLTNIETDPKILTLFIKKIKNIQNKTPFFHAEHPTLIPNAWKALPFAKINSKEIIPFIRLYVNILSPKGEYQVIEQLSIKLSEAIKHANYPLLKAICSIFRENNINYTKFKKHLPDIKLLNYFFHHHTSWTDEKLNKGFTSLLDLSWPINELNGLGQTPLHLACGYRRPSLIRFLLEKGADPKTTDNSGNTALHFAAGSCYSANLKELKSSTFQLLFKKIENQEIETFNKDGLTPLMLATTFGNKESINTLINAGAQVNLQNPVSLQTAFHIVCQTLDVTIFSKLIDNGASANILDREGKTPLHFICSKSSEPIITNFFIDSCIEKGANTQIYNKEGFFPYDLLLENNEQTLNLVVKENPSFFNPYMTTPEVFLSFTKKLPLPQQYKRLEKADSTQIKAYFREEITFSHEALSAWEQRQSLNDTEIKKLAQRITPVILLATFSITKIEHTVKKRADYKELEPLVSTRITDFREKLKILQNQIKTVQNKLFLEETDSSPIPNEFICPITKQIMENPVKDKYGHYYEAHNLTEWVKQHKTSPILGQPLTEDDFTPDLELQARIQEYQSKKRKREDDDDNLPDNKYKKL